MKILRLRPSDIVTIAFIVILLVITTAFNSAIPQRHILIPLYLIMIFAQVFIFLIKDKTRFLKFTYNIIFPLVSVLVLFDSLGWVVHHVNPKDVDPFLIKFDYMMFGVHPTVALEKIINPVLTDIFQLSYTSYYFLPIILGIALIKGKKDKEFDRSLFLVLFCFYLSYIGYILMPALGPRFTIDHLQTQELQGFLITEPIQKLLNDLEGIKRDAFPSGHTAVTLTVLYLSYRFKRILFWIFLPLVAGLVFATVYCRYHYVVDVIAGIVLAILTIMIGEWYYNQWEKKNFK
ncbi:MAG: phosphatase PAP2 family protein [Nitrospiraceae bacterium]|nr:phosphatase PAP2 family protein [Nitrospiraceae bacterium]